MIHKFVIELIDDYKGFEQDVDYLERIYGAEPIKEHDKEIYNKALDDFIENISLEISVSLIWGMIADCFRYKNMNDTSDKIVDYVINTDNRIAERLKAGDTNE